MDNSHSTTVCEEIRGYALRNKDVIGLLSYGNLGKVKSHRENKVVGVISQRRNSEQDIRVVFDVPLKRKV